VQINIVARRPSLDRQQPAQLSDRSAEGNELNMELKEDQDGWDISFKNGRVQLVQIDFRLSLLVSDGSDKVWLRVETSGLLKSGMTETPIVPAQPVTLVPVLPLFNAVVRNVRVARAGPLVIEFQHNISLRVEPDQAYEAWQVECSTGGDELLLVCPPGGDVVVFRNPNEARRAGHLH
jgi:hypothetical protein